MYRKRLVPVYIFLSLLCFYVLILSTRFEGYERGFFGTAYTFVTQHEFHMGQFGLVNAEMIDGKHYAAYVLQSILDIPLAAAGVALDSAFSHAGLDPQLTFFLPKGINAVLTALTAVVIYLFALRIYRKERLSVILAFIYGLATMAMPFANIGMDPLMTFLTIWGFYLVRRCVDTGNTGLFFLAGSVFGLAMGAKPYGFITWPFAAFYLYMLLKDNKVGGLRKKLILMAAGGIIGMVPVFWYNYLRYGDILVAQKSTGTATKIFGTSTPLSFITSLYASFFSAGKSFFLYSPPLVFAFSGFALLFKRARAEAWAFMLFAVSVVVFFCWMDFPWYWADEVWGTRYYLVFVPFLVLAIGGVVDTLKDAGILRRVCFYASVCLGFLVQIPGSLIYYGNLTDILKSSNLYSVQNAFYIPELTHLPMNAFLVWASITKRLSGYFPAYYYHPHSNIFYTLSFDPIALNIDPNADYIAAWWYKTLTSPDLGPASYRIVSAIVVFLFAGALFFGVKAFKTADPGQNAE